MCAVAVNGCMAPMLIAMLVGDTCTDETLALVPLFCDWVPDPAEPQPTRVAISANAPRRSAIFITILRKFLGSAS